MPPASRAFFLFLSNLNHNRPSPQCSRLRAPLRQLQRCHSSNTPDPLKPDAPAPPSQRPLPHPSPSALNPRLRNSTQTKPPPSSTDPPHEPTKYDIPISAWQKMPWPTRFYHLRNTLYPTFLRASPHARRSLYTSFLLLFPALFLWVHWPFETFTVRGNSMSPTLNPASNQGGLGGDLDGRQRDYVLVQKWSVNAGRLQRRFERKREESGELSNGRFERGMLVVFWCPHRRGEVAIKRVVGVPGDRVRPLAEYEGRRIWESERQSRREKGLGMEADEQEEYSVLVPYNHIWVEGDAGEHSKSVDSNWFGPISQELVVGEVRLIWSPWWNVFRAKSVDWTNGTWPARVQGRVDENVAWRSATNPDALKKFEMFETGRVEKMLTWVKARPDVILENFMGNEKMRRVYTDVYTVSARVLVSEQSDPEHRRLAKELVEAMEVVVPREVWLGKRSVTEKNARKRWVPERREKKQLNENNNHVRLPVDKEG